MDSAGDVARSGWRVPPTVPPGPPFRKHGCGAGGTPAPRIPPVSRTSAAALAQAGDSARVRISSLTRATNAASAIVSCCFSCPRRRTVTVPASASRRPSTSM